MNSTQIHIFDSTSPHGITDLIEGLVPMKTANNNEFLAKESGLYRGINEDRALNFILENLRDKYKIMIATQIENDEIQYVGYTSGFIIRRGIFQSMATFVMPEFRQRGVGVSLKKAQLAYAKAAGCEQFITVINGVNTEAYSMMEKLGCNFSVIGDKNDPSGWRVNTDL